MFLFSGLTYSNIEQKLAVTPCITQQLSLIHISLETVTYTYGAANWRDKLTAVNGNAIAYDAIGNPLSDGTWTYTCLLYTSRCV